MSVNKILYDFNKNRKNYYDEMPDKKTIQLLNKVIDDTIKEENKLKERKNNNAFKKRR